MPDQARRLPSRWLHRFPRRAGLMLCALTGIWSLTATDLSAATACIQGDGSHIRKVCLTEVPGAPSYGHDILGDTPEWDSVTVFWGPGGQALSTGQEPVATLTQTRHIFEDIHPRLVDLDADGVPEILLVQSSFQSGARLVVLGTNGALTPLAATPYIGRANRWLAPVGAADIDGDGHIEIAFVDRPHLAKTLRIWRYADGALTAVADQPGLTNHQIGQSFISGGIRHCGPRSEIITVNANWTRIIASTLQNDKINTTDIGPFLGPNSISDALTCK